MSKKYYIAPPCLFEGLPTPMDEIIPYNLNTTLEGVLSPYNVPIVKIKIKGINFEFPYMQDGVESILDTGAVKLHVTSDFARSIGVRPVEKVKGLYPLVGNVETNTYLIEFSINGIEHLFREEFAELPHLFQYPMILGTNFLGGCKSLNLDFIDKKFKLTL